LEITFCIKNGKLGIDTPKLAMVRFFDSSQSSLETNIGREQHLLTKNFMKKIHDKNFVRTNGNYEKINQKNNNFRKKKVPVVAPYTIEFESFIEIFPKLPRYNSKITIHQINCETNPGYGCDAELPKICTFQKDYTLPHPENPAPISALTTFDIEKENFEEFMDRSIAAMDPLSPPAQCCNQIQSELQNFYPGVLGFQIPYLLGICGYVEYYGSRKCHKFA